VGGDGLFSADADGCYRLVFPANGVEFHVDRLRRDKHELVCELSVAGDFARAIDGMLSVGTFNLSSTSAASQRAKLLAERASKSGFDWSSMLEELRQRVLTAERRGEPSISLRDVRRPPDDEEYDVLGLRFPKAHSTIDFGDGGTMKSYLELLKLSSLAAQGVRVLYADWELDQFTHRRRLEQICGSEMPDVRYVRCDRPLIHEVDRLRRIIRQDGIQYAVLDSVGFGTAGAPESAEAALDFNRAVRQLGTGVSAVAHITKAENGDQRPFGSAFWHNSARATWNIKLASQSADGQTVQLAAFQRKNNLGRSAPAVGIQMQFDGPRVYFERIDVTTIEEVSDALPLWQRIKAVVRSGPQTLATIASELKHDNAETLDRTVRRHKTTFTKVTGSDGITRIALLERRAS
jgi:hypothetical protein